MCAIIKKPVKIHITLPTCNIFLTSVAISLDCSTNDKSFCSFDTPNVNSVAKYFLFENISENVNIFVCM